MKQCPQCKGLELYDDTIMRCPYCEAELVPYVRKSIPKTESVQTVEPSQRVQTPVREQSTPPFEIRVNSQYQFRGIVVSVTPSSRFMSNRLKLLDSLIRGRPFQFGNPVYETIIRIEEITDSHIPDQTRVLTYYGELREVNIGDDISVESVQRNGRNIVRRITIHDADNMLVTPQNQIPGWIMRIILVSAIVICCSVVIDLFSFVFTGKFGILLTGIFELLLQLLSGLISALAPVAILCFIAWLILHGNQ